MLAALVATSCLGWGTLAGAQTCTGGTSSLALTVSGGFPALETDLHPTDWGTGGVPPMSFSVPKFDPALGTLNAVELTFHGRSVFQGCIDNPTPSCMSAQLDYAGFQTLVPSSTNVPQVTGLEFVQALGSRQVTPLGFLLGGSDGFEDCAQPGVTSGAPSMGDCTPGEDHLVVDSEILSQSDLVHLGGVDLTPWMGPVGTQVVFDSSAASLIAGSFSPLMHANLLSQARVWVDVTYHYCPATTSATVYCDCVASGPCGNHGAAGAGCANSTGLGARLLAVGTDSVTADDLELRAADLPPSQPVLFFQGLQQVGGGSGVTFGDGLRCAGGGVVRLETRTASAAGDAGTTAGLASVGGVAAGDVRRYQAWYRDPSAGPCGTAFNLSNGLELTWLP